MEKIGAEKFEWLKGDRVLWILVICLSLVSVWMVFSATINLEYIVNEGTALGHTRKHIFFIVLGLVVMRSINFIKYEYIGGLSVAGLIISLIFVGAASVTGQQIDGASAARWINIGGFSFQPSAFAYLALIIYICRFLAKKIERPRSVADIVLWLLFPILLVIGLVGKDNGSTALMILGVSMIVMVIGQFPLKYIGVFLGASTVLIGLFMFVALNTDLIKSNRVHTWKSRIEVFMGDEEKAKELGVNIESKNYQVNHAKAAIYHGGVFGVGPGKSALKHSLPQSASDFIFAIIVEEYGLFGAGLLIAGYLIIIIRIVMIAAKTPSFFGALLVLSMGVMIFVQLAVNIAVAVNLFPVTGQPLPLISYGGSAMLVTFIQLGIVLNVSSRIQVLNEEGMGKKQSIEEINDIA